MARMQKTKYHPYVELDGGVDQYHDAIELANNKLQSANNIHIDGGSLFKRPGKKPWGAQLDNPINGMYEYIDRDGNAKILVASGTELIEHSPSSSSAIDTIGNEKIYFHTLRGICFYNGETTQRKLNGSTVGDVGIASPISAAVVAAGVAGVLTGSYAVVITYVTSDGLESNPSDASNSITLSSDKLDISSIPISPDSRVIARKIYRTTAGGANYFEIGTISDNTTTTYTDNTPDAQLTELVERNHGQPEQGEIAESANDRQFWVDGSKLRFSEIAQTDAYVEYQRSLAFIEVPGKGKIKGIKALYNINTEREDLYIFSEDSICMLPQGNPNSPIVRITETIGIKQQNTITEYKNWLVFMDNENAINMMFGREVINISRRSIPKSLRAALSQENCSANIIFDHYYAITIREQKGKLYNTKIWLCDLRTMFVVQLGQADATWFPYELNAQYLLQRAEGTVLYADTNNRQIYELNFAHKRDTEYDGSLTDWLTQFRTKNFVGDSLMVRKQAKMISVKGKFQRSLLIVPYAFTGHDKSSTSINPVEIAAVFGVSVWGSVSTVVKDELEDSLDSDTIGNTFSFQFFSGFVNDQNKVVGHEDNFFEFNGFDFTYKMMLRNI